MCDANAEADAEADAGAEDAQNARADRKGKGGKGTERGDAVSSRAFDEHSQDGRELGKLPGSPCEVAPGMVSQRSERHEPELGTVLGTAPRGPCNPVRHWHGRLLPARPGGIRHWRVWK